MREADIVARCAETSGRRRIDSSGANAGPEGRDPPHDAPAQKSPSAAESPTGEDVAWPMNAEIKTRNADRHHEQSRRSGNIDAARPARRQAGDENGNGQIDRKSTRLNSSH